MKNVLFSLAVILGSVAAGSPAKAITFRRDPLSLISFPVQQNTKVIVRNSEGRIVRTKNVYGKACNLESTSLQPGNYTYTIVSGSRSSEGTFSVK